jgi:hypothetical protein
MAFVAGRSTQSLGMLMRTWVAIGVAFGVAAFVLALFGISLALIGNFTEESECFCEGADHWKCAGASCSAEAKAHFDATRHTVSCRRTDWPMRTLDALTSWLVPK